MVFDVGYQSMSVGSNRLQRHWFLIGLLVLLDNCMGHFSTVVVVADISYHDIQP